MINLMFSINREPIRFNIEGKVITYFDRKWDKGVTFMPRNPELVKYLLMNQRRFPKAQDIITWINDANSGKNLEEYDACTTEEQIADIVRRDALSKGLVEIK